MGGRGGIPGAMLGMPGAMGGAPRQGGGKMPGALQMPGAM